jgi:hypothetical protein
MRQSSSWSRSRSRRPTQLHAHKIAETNRGDELARAPPLILRQVATNNARRPPRISASARQRSQRPICLLRMFVKLDTEEALHQRTQTEFADPKQPRRNDCVEDFAGREI